MGDLVRGDLTAGLDGGGESLMVMRDGIVAVIAVVVVVIAFVVALLLLLLLLAARDGRNAARECGGWR